MYDVIIIGAGPTGSAAARELALNGYRVLMVEKFKMPRKQILFRCPDKKIHGFGAAILWRRNARRYHVCAYG